MGGWVGGGGSGCWWGLMPFYSASSCLRVSGPLRIRCAALFSQLKVSMVHVNVFFFSLV